MSVSAVNDQFVAQDLQNNEFDYRPMPVIVPVSVALGVLSASALLGVVGILIGLIGVGVGISAVFTIRRGEGMYSGSWAAWVGMLLSLTFAIVGISSQVYAFQTEVPDGYRRISFSQDISAKGFSVVEGQSGLHPEVADLVGKKIFLKGYMYPQRQTEDLTEFLLLKDTGECCFGGQPSPTDMILIQMKKGTADYSQGRMAVAGTLALTRDTTPEGLEPVYALEAIHCERSRSAF